MSRRPQQRRQIDGSNRGSLVCRASSCCSSGSLKGANHGQHHKGNNIAQRGLEWLFGVTRLQVYTNALHDNEDATKAILALIAFATLAHFAAGDNAARLISVQTLIEGVVGH